VIAFACCRFLFGIHSCAGAWERVTVLCDNEVAGKFVAGITIKDFDEDLQDKF